MWTLIVTSLDDTEIIKKIEKILSGPRSPDIPSIEMSLMSSGVFKEWYETEDAAMITYLASVNSQMMYPLQVGPNKKRKNPFQDATFMRAVKPEIQGTSVTHAGVLTPVNAVLTAIVAVFAPNRTPQVYRVWRYWE